MHLSPPTQVALADVCSEVVVLFSLIHCVLLLPLFVGVLCSVLTLLFSTLCPPSFAIILMVKRELVAYFNCLPDVL